MPERRGARLRASLDERSGALKVVHVINGLGTGGAERSLAEMLPFLRDRGIDSIVVTLYERPEGVEARVRERGFDVRRLRSSTPWGRARELRGLLRSERPDVVHTTIFESSLAGRLGAAGTGVPVLTSLVNVLYSGGRLRDPNVRRWKLEAARFVDAWTARHLTARFHAITQAVKDAAVETMRIDPGLVTVIWRGRDPERLGRPSDERRARARARLELPDDAEVVVNVGRREHQKGQHVLLEAAATLCADRPNAVVLVAGREGHASAPLQRRRRALGLEERVRFLGHRDDLPDVLAAADVFAFPSLWEGLGGSLIEAMALGLPIVASDVPAIREVVDVGRNALLVPPGDAPALAGRLADLLDDRERSRELGRVSRRRFEEHFTLARSAERMIELYGDLADRRQ